MTMVPCSCWPLAEHAIFGQNGFDASLGSVFVFINDSMPMGAYFFKSPCSFHRLVEYYRFSHFCRNISGITDLSPTTLPHCGNQAHSLMQSLLDGRCRLRVTNIRMSCPGSPQP